MVDAVDEMGFVDWVDEMDERAGQCPYEKND